MLYSAGFAARRELATRFMRAYLRGLRDYNDAIEGARLVGAKGEAIIAILTEYSLIKDPDVYRSMSVNACDPDGRLDMPSLEYDLGVFRAEGLIEGEVSVADVVDTSFADAVVRELGAWRKA